MSQLKITLQLSEKKKGDFYTWTTPGIEKDRDLTPPEKIKREKINQVLTEKAEIRDPICWAYGCTNKSHVWVREVQYDFKQEMKDKIDHAVVSSRDYNGPVPGFCMGHLHNGPMQLAETIYFSRQEMYWGLRPNRWWIIFTDGSKTGGLCQTIDPKQEMPTVKDEFVRS
jgi:hypothetical protein